MSSKEEMKNKPVAVLKTDLVEARKELVALRFRHAANSLTDTSSLGKLKKKIARINTFIAQKSK